jgi:drug/metabolite transporter (DMT)-like permease
MQIRSRAYAQMHAATFLWGITAILGKLISISEFPLVWYRVFLISVVMLFIPGLLKQARKLSAREIYILSGIGILIALHWVAWYGSIKYANASVAVSCIAIISLFVALLEPLINRTPFVKSDILLGLVVIPGILLINESLELNFKFGFLLGILAAFFAAIFTILNKKYTQHLNPNIITFTQMLSGWVFLTLCLPFYMLKNPGNFHIPGVYDFILLVVLAVFCTIIPYNLFLRALKASNAFTTSLINNLEPVYGIILAVILLQENKQLNWKFYAGTGIILSAVFIHAYLSNKKQSNTSI